MITHLRMQTAVRFLTALTLAAVLASAGAMQTVAQTAPQGTRVGFGGLQQDTTAPIEVTADQLEINRSERRAVFSGNVLVIQGEMRMSAAEVRVSYAEDGGGIDNIHATGGVTLVTDTEAAEAREALYTVENGDLVMTGAVMMTQGDSTISGERLVANLTDGTGVMEGRVRTVFQPAEREGATKAMDSGTAAPQAAPAKDKP